MMALALCSKTSGESLVRTRTSLQFCGPTKSPLSDTRKKIFATVIQFSGLLSHNGLTNRDRVATKKQEIESPAVQSVWQAKEIQGEPPRSTKPDFHLSLPAPV
jgi:hypothetical protein